MVNLSEIEQGFKDCGLKNGDVVFLHSSYKSFGGVEGGPQTVIEALISVIGKEGTLIVPTFNFDFSSNNVPWDSKSSPSQMGIISEIVRKNPNSRRLLHPIYSFSILGKLSNELGSLRVKSCFGEDSIFSKLRELNGKIMQIDSVYKGTTFFHHVEEMERCTYRYLKEFSGNVTDENGTTFKGTFPILVRDLSQGIVTNIKPIGKILVSKGIIQVNKIGDATIWLMNCNDLYKETALEMKKNPHILCNVNRKMIGKVVLIIKPNNNMGKSLGQIFADQGTTVILCSDNKLELEKISRDLGAYNDYDVFYEVSENFDDQQLIDSIKKTNERFGKIDILVHNSNILKSLKSFSELSELEYKKFIDLKFPSELKFRKIILPFLEKNKNSMINITFNNGNNSEETQN